MIFLYNKNIQTVILSLLKARNKRIQIQNVSRVSLKDTSLTPSQFSFQCYRNKFHSGLTGAGNVRAFESNCNSGQYQILLFLPHYSDWLNTFFLIPVLRFSVHAYLKFNDN